MDLIPDINKDKLQRNQIEYLQKQQKENKHIGSMRPVPGHTLFSFNRKTGEIKVAEWTGEAIVGMNGKPLVRKKVQIEQYCFYDQALNRKNFIKRLKRYGFLVE